MTETIFTLIAGIAIGIIIMSPLLRSSERRLKDMQEVSRRLADLHDPPYLPSRVGDGHIGHPRSPSEGPTPGSFP